MAKLFKMNVFTDGSDLGKHNNSDNLRYGVVAAINENTVFKISGRIDLVEFEQKYQCRASNPYAELYAIYSFVRSVQQNPNIKNVMFTIYSDYEGVQKWINGEWKAKKPYIRQLVWAIYRIYDMLRKDSRNVLFYYKWVKGHQTEDCYLKRMNDLADTVARDENCYNEIHRLFARGY